MHKELTVKGRTLAGVSDLTLFARIRDGFVPSLEAVTYKTRLQMLLRTLSAARHSSQEYSLLRPFSDAVERVGAIHSVRVVVLEPENRVMLAATFDGAWETYLRTLWLKVGTLLDAIFCNTEDYVISADASYEQWAGWARRVQVETPFFYGLPDLTVPDVQVLRRTEAMVREGTAGGGSPPAVAGLDQQSPGDRRLLDRGLSDLVAQRAEDLAWQQISVASAGDPRVAEVSRQALQALSVLYRLAEVYLPGTPDGTILRRAARDLLLEFVESGGPARIRQVPPLQQRFQRQLDWFDQPTPERAGVPVDGLPKGHQNVQGGLLSGYPNQSQGALLLLAFDGPAAAAAFLGAIVDEVSVEGPAPEGRPVRLNLAFTHEGLRALGLGDEPLGRFPMEFRQGMEARCSVLGDLRANHPRRWRLPLREGALGPVRVEMSQVHAVAQLRLCDPAVRGAHDDWRDPAHPLHPDIERLRALPGARLLAVQTMWTQRDAAQPQVVREHFGFADGLSQPQPAAVPAPAGYDNTVPVGDLLLGYATGHDPAAGDALLRDGSFLVVRKLRQHVHALKQALARAVPDPTERDQVLQRMMGRSLNGAPLAKDGAADGDNDFDYQGDAAGARCPFQAHVRRANPRTHKSAAPRLWRETPVPRILRRGMSYGPAVQPDEAVGAHDEPERGVVFMAYNARLGEQFEQIQRWVSGGNSGGGLSSPGDPFMGVPKPGQPVTFRWTDGSGSVRRVALRRPLDAAGRVDWRPFVTLDWGLYLFTPSISGLRALQDAATQAAATAAAQPVAWSAEDGERIIQDLLQRQARPGADGVALWKQALEDPVERREHRSASVWAAIRAFHGGVLRTPFGVLVADADLVDQVFRDTEGRYSVKGYRERTSVAFGEIYLGLDRSAPGGDYDRQAQRTNAAIRSITRDAAFTAARRYALEVVAKRVAETQAIAAGFGLPEFELTLDLKEVSDPVLASLSEDWFGLQDGGELVRGGLDWAWEPGKPPPYPGHFTAPSRYVFQPHPGRVPMQMGPVHGQAVRSAVRQFGQRLRNTGQRPTCPLRPDPAAPGGQTGGGDAVVGAATFDDPMAATDLDWFARTLVGALVGFLPSVDGNYRATLNEWLSSGEFWRLRGELAADPQSDRLGAAHRWVLPAVLRAMQLRAVPETVWRTATRPHALGQGPQAVAVGADDHVVVAIVSATQQRLGEGVADVMPVFGGARSAGLPAPGEPVHACPGYEAGMGALLGLYSALLGLPWQVRPAPAPLSLTLTGLVPAPAPPA